MPDIAIINTVVPLGLGGVIAVIVLIWKRQDDARATAREIEISDKLFGIVQANTAAMQGLTTAVSSQFRVELDQRVTRIEQMLARDDGKVIRK